MMEQQENGFIYKCFYAVAYGLQKWANATGLTYNEVNILVYYLAVPLTWTVLFDVGLRLPLATPLLLFVWLCVFAVKRKHFKTWCDDVFSASVNFLLSFKHIGWSYEKASVIICVAAPLAVYVLLVAWAAA